MADTYSVLIADWEQGAEELSAILTDPEEISSLLDGQYNGEKFNVQICHNQRQLAKYLQGNSSLDIAIVDWADAGRVIRQQYPQLPLIYTSPELIFGQNEPATESLDDKTYIVSKPFQPQELVTVLYKAVTSERNGKSRQLP